MKNINIRKLFLNTGTIKYAASFTVEAAYVISIVLITLGSIIITAFSMRDRTVSAYITHEASVDTAFSEPKWEEIKSTPESAAAKSAELFKSINSLSGAYENTCLENEKGNAYVSHGPEEKDITVRVNNTEKYMRMNTIIEDWKDKTE